MIQCYKIIELPAQACRFNWNLTPITLVKIKLESDPDYELPVFNGFAGV